PVSQTLSLHDARPISSIGLAYHRLEGFSTDLERIAEQENVQQERIKENVTKIEAHENQLRTLGEDILAKEKNLATQQRSTQAYINKIRSYKSDKKNKNERIIHLQEKETRITAELNHDRNQLEHVQYRIKRLNEELFEEQGKLDVFGLDIDRKQTEVEELRG